MEYGLLLLRLVVGLTLAAHGAQKLFGWFGGYGLAGTGGWLESLGFRPGRLQATLAGSGELFGGLLLALGLLTPIGAALIIAVMFVASRTVHRGKGFFATAGGSELVFVLGAVALGLAITGPGRLSLDAALGIDYSPTQGAAAALLLGLLGGVGALVTRTRAPAEAH